MSGRWSTILSRCPAANHLTTNGVVQNEKAIFPRGIRQGLPCAVHLLVFASDRTFKTMLRFSTVLHSEGLFGSSHSSISRMMDAGVLSRLLGLDVVLRCVDPFRTHSTE
eukprot:630622-Prorocentrum_minimum.AAC.1